jgi:hypothetical protein
MGWPGKGHGTLSGNWVNKGPGLLIGAPLIQWYNLSVDKYGVFIVTEAPPNKKKGGFFIGTKPQ